jgi:radical SAM superfamily enzyme YgiQ (UPF0313 family)
MTFDPLKSRATTFQDGDERVNLSDFHRTLPKDPSPKDFRVLLVYPNYMMVNLLPTNIGILTTCLRQNGFEVALFDTTYYRTAEKSPDEIRVENLQLRKFSLEDFGIELKRNDFLDDFETKVRNFKPDLIGYSVVEDTWPQAARMIARVRHFQIPTIVGGVFPTLAPEHVSKQPGIDMLCVGEGERALIDLCYRMWRKQDYSSVSNLWIKKEGGWIQNPLAPPLSLDDVPFSDWTFFEKERFYRPMQGKIFRMVPVETDRGCPYTCRFCEAPSIVGLYRESTGLHYFRRKSWDLVKDELEMYISQYQAEYIYFNAETFLAMGDQDFDRFIEIYSKIRLPFWIQTRVETLSEYRIQKLEHVNCNRISIGLEHGNAEFRKKVVGKGFSNQAIVDVFNTLDKYSIPVTINNMLGFPGETRELIFDTIELNRQLNTDSVNAFYFMPYRGTAMRAECEEKGYITDDSQTQTPMFGPIMKMPQLSNDMLLGLVRTFSLYVKFPKEDWPEIQIAEKFDEEGNAKFAQLSKRYHELFFDDDLKRSKKACFSTATYRLPKRGTEDVTPA